MVIDFEKNLAEMYTNTIPPKSEIIGVVTVDGKHGALVKLQSGQYVRVNAGVVTSLNQREVKELLNQDNGE